MLTYIIQFKRVNNGVQETHLTDKCCTGIRTQLSSNVKPKTCLAGYFSYRHTLKGSWFIQCLVEILFKYHWLEDVNTMMTRVNRKVALGN